MSPAAGPPSRAKHRRPAAPTVAAYLLAIAALTAGGCASTGSSKWVSLRSTPRNPLTDALGLVAKQGPKPTERTLQLLRRYNLEDKLGDKPALFAELNAINRREPNREHLYALAELAYIGAKRADAAMKSEEALELYGSSVLYSYEYLFDDSYTTPSNEFDPQFRRACDLYNSALEGTLRIVQSQGALRPGTSRIIKTANHDCQLEVQLKSKGWHEADFDRVEFVSDYEVHGLRNHYHNFGLGVPLIAIRRHHEPEDATDAAEQFYPPDLSFAVTAFLRIDADSARESDDEIVPTSTAAFAAPPAPPQKRTLHAVLELHDPLDSTHVDAEAVRVPLETDLSTPLAHNLSQPALDEDTLSTAGLLTPEKADRGLYMLEPFRADKIPVVMVHGLWSSPVTWMEMFNDLRSDPAIRENYQFWFYLYPSGQPFWQSAAEMREDLAKMRVSLDPQRRSPALDQMILVGHSMGGLVSRLQTVDSGNEFWRTLSDKPFTDLQADAEIRDDLAETFFFDPNPSIRRVVTIGTPHRGSEFSNDFTKWVGRKLITVPTKLMHGRSQLASRNPEYFLPSAPLNITNSIDSLSPKSPLLPVLLEAPAGPWVKHHNIIGQAPREGVTNKVSMWLSGEGDGVVSLESARLDTAASQIVVPSDHMSVHRHPQSILEVRRILLQNVAELQNFPHNGAVQYATSASPPGSEPPTPQLPGPIATLPAVEKPR